MGFYLQISCNSCGYKTPGMEDEHCLIDSMGLPEFHHCVCNQCHRIFQRGYTKTDGKVVQENKCVFCGSEDIEVHEEISYCPKCSSADIEWECVGTFF